MESIQIFISYRRDGGEALAQLLYERLTEDGYKVFLDVESLRSGMFNTAIFDKIDKCTDFLLILPPHGLDRCKAQNDWVRLEIEHAIKEGKNIVPIRMRNFEFPDELPDSLSGLPFYEGIRADFELFDGVMKKLKEKLLKSKVEKSDQLLTIIHDLYTNIKQLFRSFNNGKQSHVDQTSSLLNDNMHKLYEYNIVQCKNSDENRLIDTIISSYNGFVESWKYFDEINRSHPELADKEENKVYDSLYFMLYNLTKCSVLISDDYSVPNREKQLINRSHKYLSDFINAIESADQSEIQPSLDGLSNSLKETFKCIDDLPEDDIRTRMCIELIIAYFNRFASSYDEYWNARYQGVGDEDETAERFKDTINDLLSCIIDVLRGFQEQS